MVWVLLTVIHSSIQINRSGIRSAHVQMPQPLWIIIRNLNPESSAIDPDPNSHVVNTLQIYGALHAFTYFMYCFNSIVVPFSLQ